MSDKSILLSIASGVAEITLNRPDKLNSFTRAMHVALRAALTQVRADVSVRAILLTGTGRGFCAGQDLADVIDPATGKPGAVSNTLQDDYHPLIHTLQEIGLPVICAVNGVAAGAGANIALACDIVLAARSAHFIQAFVKIGLVPDAGGSYMLPRLIGLARAKALAMLGDKLDAETAERWGLIWRCVDDAQLMPEARKLARHLATQPTKAIGLIKRAMHVSAGNDLAAQLAVEMDFQGQCAQSSDYQEGVGAFLEKRQAVFTGK
jgi:2-(1,2-epoxy-1,2-dihydrophenyl)acetyl-CoA isomerase